MIQLALFPILVNCIVGVELLAPLCSDQQSLHYLTTTRSITTVIKEIFTLAVDSPPPPTRSSAPLQVSATSQSTGPSTGTDLPSPSTLPGSKNVDPPSNDSSALTSGYSNAAYYVNW